MDYRLSDCGPWTVDRGPWTVDCGPWTVDRGPWTVDCGPWTVDRPPYTNTRPQCITSAFRLLLRKIMPMTKQIAATIMG